MPRVCKTSPNNFCYVCGSFTSKTQRRTITKDLKKIYHLYFACPLGDQEMAWAPHIICASCSNGLRDWLNGRKKSMPFAVPMVWREPRDHCSDCYFCMVNISGYSEKTKHKIEYKNLDSARRPIPHDDEMPVPTPPKDKIVSINDETVCEEAISEGESASGDPQYTPDITETDLEPFSQEELNDLIRNLSLSKEKAELLSSRL